MVGSLVRLVGAFISANFQSELEHRFSTLAHITIVILENCLWVVFWQAYFSRYPVIGDWELPHVLALWSIMTVGTGLGGAFFQNVWNIPRTILSGRLDHFLLLPRPVLLNLMFYETSLIAWGDVAFGTGLFILGFHPSLADFLWFGYLSASGAILFVSFGLLLGALTFFTTGGEQLLWEGLRAFLSFSQYPTLIFSKPLQLVLYTLIPAAYMAFVPVLFLKTHSLLWLGVQTTVVLLVASLAILVFQRGLRRYESGSVNQ